MSAISDHLNRITPENMSKWKSTAIAVFASHSGKNGHIELCCDLHGAYIVRVNKELQFKFFLKINAINKYKELCS